MPELEREQAAVVRAEVDRAVAEGKIVLRTNGVPHDPVDRVRARGVPIVGPGSAGGAIAGTRPDHAVFSRERRERYRRKL